MHNGLIAYEFSVPCDVLYTARDAEYLVRLVDSQKQAAMSRAGEAVLKEIGEGNRATVKYEWRSQMDVATRCQKIQLSVDLCPVQRRQVSLTEFPAMGLPTRLKPQPILSRIGRFFAEKWREAGETAEACRAG